MIVGRPNVGKSTLFNAILGQRRSIVGDEPGITRDRIVGEASYLGRHFDLIDTGGIIPNDAEMIPSEILKQARVALETASHVIFLIDGRAEITGADRDLAAMLRAFRETRRAGSEQDRFAKARGPGTRVLTRSASSDLFPISAEHRLGLEDLMDHVTHGLPADAAPVKTRGKRTKAVELAERTELAETEKVRKQEAKDKRTEAGEPELVDEETEDAAGFALPIKVAIIGRPNVGKSTLLNALAGSELVHRIAHRRHHARNRFI